MTSQADLDHSAIDNLLESVGGDREFLAELIDVYFSDSANLFGEMRESLAAGDADRFRRAAHSLKSNSASFGATALAELARTLEEKGKVNHLGDASPLLEAAAAEYERVRPALEAVRNAA
jgi:HPt (histidine-containing phosphotransfer) domain-containing protein